MLCLASIVTNFGASAAHFQNLAETVFIASLQSIMDTCSIADFMVAARDQFWNGCLIDLEMAAVLSLVPFDRANSIHWSFRESHYLSKYLSGDEVKASEGASSSRAAIFYCFELSVLLSTKSFQAKVEPRTAENRCDFYSLNGFRNNG